MIRDRRREVTSARVTQVKMKRVSLTRTLLAKKNSTRDKFVEAWRTRFWVISHSASVFQRSKVTQTLVRSEIKVISHLVRMSKVFGHFVDLSTLEKLSAIVCSRGEISLEIPADDTQLVVITLLSSNCSIVK